MSVSLIFQGLPPESGLVEAVRREEWPADGVSLACSWLVWGERFRGEIVRLAPGAPYPWPPNGYEHVWRWCCDAIGRFPELPSRRLDVHKSYQWLPFVLSAKVRKRLRWPRPDAADPRSWNDPESEFDQLSEQAFEGAPQLAPGVTGGQGLPIRLMERNVVRDFGLCVGAMEQGEVAQRISELVDLDIFQTWDVPRCEEIFSDFQCFFAEAATRGEDVLVVWE